MTTFVPAEKWMAGSGAGHDEKGKWFNTFILNRTTLLLAILVTAFALFFLVSFVLARDDGPFAHAIRLSEILLPLAAAVTLSGLFLKGFGPVYFPAACAFGLAVAIALLRRLPSLWFSRPPEGAYVFAYSLAIVAGLALAALA